MRLLGKTALITAAGQGIGRACALAMAEQGATVWATDVNPDVLATFKGVTNIQTAVLDVLDKKAIHDLVAQLPSIDILFNCAGYVHNGSILPNMLARGGGSIINMASVCGASKGLPNRFIYGASKAAVVGLTKAVAADYVGQGIRCNAIAPGTVDTPSLGERINSYDDPIAARKAFIARQPMGRLAQAAEIAPIVIYLASDESVFATGQLFTVDGGMMI